MTVAPEMDLGSEGLERTVGLWGLMWASEGSIIGSGWLFGALGAVAVAGPSAIFGWAIASVIIIIIALVHAELGGLFPVTGGTSRFPHYAFGSLAGGVFGWFSYIQAVAVAPIEVTAMLQYLASAHWARHFYNGKTISDWPGLVVALGLMIIFTAINLIGIQWLARTNTSITTWKVLFPIFAMIVLLFTHFHSGNFSADGGFFIKGAAFKSIVETFPAGVIFALLGFEQAVQLGGESANPKRDLPRAVIGSVLIGAVFYILAQVAFIGALDPKTLIEAKTWAGLQNTALSSGPFYTVARVAGLGWLAWLLRADAVISPGGTGLIYLTSASRIGFGLSKNGYIPTAFEKTDERRKVPYVGIIITAVLGMVFLLPFPSWQSLVGVVTDASVIMYAGAPLALGALRRSKPELARVYTLPGGEVMAVLAFTLCNYVIYYAGWQVYSTLMFIMVVGLVLIGLSYALKLNPNTPAIDWEAAIWIVPYLVGMGVISYLGSFGTGGIFSGLYGFKHTLVGGHNHLHIYWDNLVILIFSTVIYLLAMQFRLSGAKVDEYVRDVYPPPIGE